MAKPHVHDASALDIPAALCRLCHPELNTLPDERSRMEAAERADRKRTEQRRSKERSVRKAEERLAKIMKREPEPGTVDAKVVKGLRQKLTRLRKELDVHN